MRAKAMYITEQRIVKIYHNSLILNLTSENIDFLIVFTLKSEIQITYLDEYPHTAP